MSRDMLAFEPQESKRLGFGRERLRQFLLKIIQIKSLTSSEGVIYLSNYAATNIQRQCGKNVLSTVIPHGVGRDFASQEPMHRTLSLKSNQINLVYVSPIWMFKHQWHVVKAVRSLREKHINVFLTLIGGSSPRAMKKLNHELLNSDPAGEFTRYLGNVSHDLIPAALRKADIFVFASSCENMPNSLVEAMAVGLPIASSNRGPMPEVLGDGGVYFDPEDPQSIADAIIILITDPLIRRYCSDRARQLSKKYSWKKCADETFSFLKKIGSKGNIILVL